MCYLSPEERVLKQQPATRINGVEIAPLAPDDSGISCAVNRDAYIPYVAGSGSEPTYTPLYSGCGPHTRRKLDNRSEACLPYTRLGLYIPLPEREI